MEATGIYWRPVWHVLEGQAELVLANAQHIKNVPGRKTDVNDAMWIADLLAHGLIRSSFVPPQPIQELRDLTRTRKQLVREISQHSLRIQKVLEDANIKGRKRHIVTDTEGFVIASQVHAANIQDPHGAVPRLGELRRRFPKLRHIFADRVYRGPQLRAAIDQCGPWTIEIERPPGVKGFQLLPRRWVVERTFAWLGRSRHLAKDFEATIESAAAWLLLASIRLLFRRLARP